VSGLINNYLSDQKYKGQVTIEGDKNLSSGEVRVDWDNGFMSFSLPDITQNILSKFDRINSNNQI
jgi:flagellar biosynthesis/type III secretory pathway protein FliH